MLLSNESGIVIRGGRYGISDGVWGVRIFLELNGGGYGGVYVTSYVLRLAPPIIYLIYPAASCDDSANLDVLHTSVSEVLPRHRSRMLAGALASYH